MFCCVILIVPWLVVWVGLLIPVCILLLESEAVAWESVTVSLMFSLRAEVLLLLSTHATKASMNVCSVFAPSCLASVKTVKQRTRMV